MRAVVLTLILLFAVCVYAQDQQITSSETHTSTSPTTYNGTLVDAGCRSTEVVETHTTTIGVSRQTEVAKANSVECPVTPATTSYGLLTPDGRYIRFDQTSNIRVGEIVKNNKSWNKEMRQEKPIHVEIVGSANGGAFIVDSMH